MEEISHIGIVVNDLDEAVAQWTGRFGFTEVERMSVEVEGVRSAFVSTGHARGEGMVVELIEPFDKTDMASPITRRLAEVGEGFFHLAIFSDDPTADSARLKAEGVTVIDLPPPSPDEPPRAVVHPKSANGVLLEILARPR